MHAFTSSDRMIDGNEEDHEKNSENCLNAILWSHHVLYVWIQFMFMIENVLFNQECWEVRNYVIIYRVAQKECNDFDRWFQGHRQ